MKKVKRMRMKMSVDAVALGMFSILKVSVNDCVE